MNYQKEEAAFVKEIQMALYQLGYGETFLVPIDGSELSYMAVAGAASFAKPLGAEVVVMTVIEPYSYTNLSEYRPESIDQYDSRVKDQARERLEKARTYFDRMLQEVFLSL